MNSDMEKLKRYSFVLLLVIGVVASWGVRLLLEDTTSVPNNARLQNHAGSIIAIVISIVCMGVYLFIVWRDKPGQHESDNLYYMGLLFTLASLVYSLVILFIFNTAEEHASARVNNLVGSFGIALISTFLGILLRILLLQKSDRSGSLSEPGEQGPISHPDLAETAFRLRQELTQTLADMRVFRIGFVQANDETVQEAGKARAAMLQHVTEAAGEQVRIFAHLTQTVQEPLEALAKAQTEQLQQTVGRGEKLEAVFNTLEEALQSTMRNLQSTAKGSHDLTIEYAALNTRLQESAHLWGKVGEEINQSAEILTATTEALSKSLSEATQAMPQYTEEFAQLIASLRQEAEQWQGMTQEVRSSLVEAVAKLTQTVKQ